MIGQSHKIYLPLAWGYVLILNTCVEFQASKPIQHGQVVASCEASEVREAAAEHHKGTLC